MVEMRAQGAARRLGCRRCDTREPRTVDGVRRQTLRRLFRRRRPLRQQPEQEPCDAGARGGAYRAGSRLPGGARVCGCDRGGAWLASDAVLSSAAGHRRGDVLARAPARRAGDPASAAQSPHARRSVSARRSSASWPLPHPPTRVHSNRGVRCPARPPRELPMVSPAARPIWMHCGGSARVSNA